MSIESLALALHHSRAKGTAKLVLLGIANHDGDGGAWPSIKTLAKYSCCDERQVQRALKHLEELGEIRRLVGAGGNQNTRADRRPNRYQVLLSCPPSCDGSKEHRQRGDTDATPQPHGVTSTAPRGDIHGSHGVVEMSPEPSLEPSMNQETRKSRSRHRRPIDQGWNLSPELLQELKVKFPKVDVESQVEPFVDYWLARGEARADWNATFRTWMRNQDKWRREKAGVSEGGWR
jgi:hypothetical protein